MRRLLASLTALVVLLAAGCSSSAGADEFTIVATVYPLAWLAQEIAPDADVQSLTSAGQDPHDQELTPQQRAAIDSADLVLHLGDIGFQPQVEAAVAGRSGVVSVADVVGHDALLPLGAHGEEAENAGEEDEHAEDHDADGDAVDPHFWFDTALLAQVATAVGDAAAAADGDNAGAYRERATKVRARIEEVGDEIGDLLSSCRHDTVVVGHEAFAYLLEPHGIEQHGISGAGGHGDASPADIAALVDEIRERGLPAVLTEPVEGRRDAEVVAREAGVDLIEIYSLDIVAEAEAQRGLPTLLVEQAEAVARAAGCDT